MILTNDFFIDIIKLLIYIVNFKYIIKEENMLFYEDVERCYEVYAGVLFNCLVYNNCHRVL